MNKAIKKGTFRYTKWDPILLATQIAAVQATFYVVLGTVFLIIGSICGISPSIELVFNSDLINFKSKVGLLITSCYVINSVLSSGILVLVVTRAKLCLDFSVTTTLIHVVFVWFLNGGFPFSLSFWILMSVSSAIMCVGGEYLCIQHEMRAIPLISTTTRNRGDNKGEKEAIL